MRETGWRWRSAQPPEIVGPARIIDGDTLAVGPVVIRINGIDAAELGQRCKNATGGTWPCDETAADRLEQLIGTDEIRCDPLDRDAYGRIIGRCFAGEIDVAKTLAAEGLAWAFARYSSEYVAEEEDARSRGVGVWQAPTQAPWDYRANRWERAAEEAARVGCPIKGNINQKGERIYHTVNRHRIGLPDRLPKGTPRLGEERGPARRSGAGGGYGPGPAPVGR